MPFNGVYPAIMPDISPFGLLSVADVTEHTMADSHWVNGFQYEIESCGFNASLLPICAPGDSNIPLIDDANAPNYRGNVPFGIRVEKACLVVGWSVIDRKASVLRELDLVTQKAIEMELWVGSHAQLYTQQDDRQYLTNPDTLNELGTGGVSLGLGLAMLERALGDCGAGSKGVIHMPRDVATLLDTHIAPDEDDGKTLLTKNNHNFVVSGSGYTGSGPGEIERANELNPWIYATGPLVVHFGEPEVITPRLVDATNVRTNEIIYVAIKPAAVYWDGCCHFGVQVDLTKP